MFKFLCLAAAFTLMATNALAASPYPVTNAVLRVTPAQIGAAYVTLENPGATADALTGAQALWAAKVELHQTSSDATGVMRMRPVIAIPLPAKGKAVLQQGGYHIMLFGIKGDLQTGAQKTITLSFKSGLKMDVRFTVQPLAAPHDMHHGMKM